MVLRAGPPRSRGLVVDTVVGILGVGLLVMAAVLGAVLPEEETPPRQFQVAYPQDGQEALICCAEGQEDPALSAREAGVVPEGEAREYEVFVEHDNAFQFQVTLTVSRLVGDTTASDDIQSSDPDSFSLLLLDPDGVERGNLSLTTPAPSPNPDQNSTQLFVSRGVSSGPVSMRYAAKPSTEFVPVNDTSVTKGEVLAEIGPQRTIPTQGTWTVRVEVVEAGDCPDPAPDPLTLRRALACQEEAQSTGGEDPGNPYTLEKVRYDFYSIEVTAPEDTPDAEA